jgi:hypothetical protein
MPEDAAWADPVVVPDDIRELQGDIDAYHRELRHARRRLRWQRLTASPGWQRWGFPAGMLTGAIALAAVVFALLAVDGRTHPEASPGPLARPSAAVGSVGGLLPDVTLTTTNGTKVAARSLRPALIALLPAHCNCAATVRSLAGQAEEVQLRLVVVAPDAPDAEIAALPGQLHYTDVVAAYDSGGRLATTYGSSAVTALILGRDGVVTYLQPDVTATTRLEGPLQTALLLAPAPSH